MKQYLSTDDINIIHVEISSYCNASCPMCARNNHGSGLRPNFIENQWTLEDIDRVFTDELINLKQVLFCGTHGDPITAKYLIETVEHIKSMNVSVQLHTNGSLRSTAWWSSLTNILTEQDRIVFGIDGIETNQLYRQNTSIDKILERIRIAATSKCQVWWDFLAFRHNEHELERCQTIAKSMGVDRFRIRKTARFDNWGEFPVKDDRGQVIRLLQQPINKDLVHSDLEKMSELKVIMKDSNFKNTVDYNITCMYQQEKKIYVNSLLEVFPCCYISDDNENNHLNKMTNQILVPYENFSLRTRSWSQIMSHDFYANDLVDSFDNPKQVLKRCIKTCGVIKREANQNESITL